MSEKYFAINPQIDSPSRQKSRSKAVVPPRPPGRVASSLVVLNLDILRHILLFIEGHKDLLTAMSTCHALYNAGIQPLVRLPIVIREDAIRSFHDFMFSHSPATFLAFRALRLACYELSIEDTEPFLELLRRGTNLRQLELPFTVFSDNKGIGEAVVCLRELEELCIGCGFHNGIDRILTQLHSPLVKINIQFDNNDDTDPILDPALLLANFQNTLEQATIIAVPLLTSAFRYPKLMDLEIHLSGEPSLSVLATTFPNLQTLFISIAELGVERLRDLRDENVAFQNGRRCWESLTSVHADADVIYAMGLKNTFKSVTITSFKYPSVPLEILRTAISTTRTEALSLHLLDAPFSLSEMLIDAGNPSLSLELTLEILQGADDKIALASTCLPALNLAYRD